MNWLNGGSSYDLDNSFSQWLGCDSALFLAVVRRGGHFYKALCVNALSLERVPHLADANTLGQLSVLYLLVASKFCIYASENTSSMSVDCELQKVFFFLIIFIFFSTPFLFTHRVTVHNLQTSKLLRWKQGQAFPWIYHPEFPGGSG